MTDGDLGRNTNDAIRKFQEQFGLEDRQLTNAELRVATQAAVDAAFSRNQAQAVKESLSSLESPRDWGPFAPTLSPTQVPNVPQPVEQTPQTLTTPDQPLETPRIRGPVASSGRNERDDDGQEDLNQRQDQAQTFPNNHNDYALFLVIQQNLPKGTSDEKTAQVMYEAKEGRIVRADQFEKIGYNDQGIYVMGKTWGSHTGTISLTDPAPTIETTLQMTEALDKQRAEELTLFRQEQADIAKNPTGPVMTLGMRGPATPPPAPSGPPDGGGEGGGE